MLARRRVSGPHPRDSRTVRVALVAAYVALSACSADNGFSGTVELGDDFVAPDLQLDEDFFYCRIQPEVLTQHSCARGSDGEQGSCHDTRSALRLIATDAPPPCDGDGNVVDAIPQAYMDNLDAVRFAVQSNPLTSPLYLRPLERASHPRMIFDTDDEAAQLIVDWIAGATP